MKDPGGGAKTLGQMAPIRIDRVITRLNIGAPSQHAIILTDALNDERFRSRLICGRVGPGEWDMTPAPVGQGLSVTQQPALPSCAAAVEQMRRLAARRRASRV